MLAGPKTYQFGTKIHLDWLGIGVIDDRGGAIVSSWSRWYDADRIDVWMWQGEEGLRRALSWGKRRISGTILSDEDVVEGHFIDFSNIKIANIRETDYKPQQKIKTKEAISIFNTTIDAYAAPERIKELQTILSQLSYYHGVIDGKYSKILEDAIYDFQMENQIIDSKKNAGAWYFWAKTRTKLQEIYTLYTENEKKRIAEEIRIAQQKAEYDKQVATEKAEVTLFVENLGAPKSDEVGVHVRNLQKSLKLLGYFTGRDTAIFGKNTRAALISYQIDQKIPKEELGKIGKSTKNALSHDLFALKNTSHTGISWNGK